MTASDEPPMKSSSSVTDEPWPGYEGNDTSMNNNTTADSQLLLLAVRRRVHDETMSNWTGSFDDPIYDYLNIPVVKVW